MENEQKLVEYIDYVFFKEPKDVNGIEYAIDMFFENYKKNTNFIDGDFMLLIERLFERIKKEKEIFDNDYISLLVGVYLGCIIQRYSKKLKYNE